MTRSWYNTFQLYIHSQIHRSRVIKVSRGIVHIAIVIAVLFIFSESNTFLQSTFEVLILGSGNPPHLLKKKCMDCIEMDKYDTNWLSFCKGILAKTSHLEIFPHIFFNYWKCFFFPFNKIFLFFKFNHFRTFLFKNMFIHVKHIYLNTFNFYLRYREKIKQK